MRASIVTTALLGVLASAALSQTPAPPTDRATAVKDDFKREGKRERKDPLEGKPAPPLQLTNWMNTGEGGLTLGALRGKVVLLKFWGVW